MEAPIAKNTSKKRKRNTTEQQHNIYVQEMEADYYFRSGTINPTLGDDYINKKGEQLTSKLNCVGNGPQLTTTEWIKRFKDWKNATRAKQRRILQYRDGTGGGPPLDLKLSEVEDRAISVWGRICVTGNKQVNIEGGLDAPPHIQEAFGEDTAADDPIASDEEIFIEVELPGTPVQDTPKRNISETYIPKTGLTGAPDLRQRESEPKSKRSINRPATVLSEIAANLLTAYEENSANVGHAINNFTNAFENVENKKIELQTKKLNFEICKYKFGNPEFHYTTE